MYYSYFRLSFSYTAPIVYTVPPQADACSSASCLMQYVAIVAPPQSHFINKFCEFFHYVIPYIAASDSKYASGGVMISYSPPDSAAMVPWILSTKSPNSLVDSFAVDPMPSRAFQYSFCTSVRIAHAAHPAGMYPVS